MDPILRLRELMNSRGWSEYRLAKESKLSMSTISNIFHRGSIPSIPTLETLCNTFGISLGQFFSDGDEPISLTPEQKEMFEAYNSIFSNNDNTDIGNSQKGDDIVERMDKPPGNEKY